MKEEKVNWFQRCHPGPWALLWDCGEGNTVVEQSSSPLGRQEVQSRKAPQKKGWLPHTVPGVVPQSRSLQPDYVTGLTPEPVRVTIWPVPQSPSAVLVGHLWSKPQASLQALLRFGLYSAYSPWARPWTQSLAQKSLWEFNQNLLGSAFSVAGCHCPVITVSK